MWYNKKYSRKRKCGVTQLAWVRRSCEVIGRSVRSQVSHSSMCDTQGVWQTQSKDYWSGTCFTSFLRDLSSSASISNQTIVIKNISKIQCTFSIPRAIFLNIGVKGLYICSLCFMGIWRKIARSAKKFWTPESAQSSPIMCVMEWQFKFNWKACGRSQLNTYSGGGGEVRKMWKNNSHYTYRK